MKNISKIIKTLQKYQAKQKEPTIRRTSRIDRDPYKTLITCLLSLRTQDKNTETASSKLFAVADIPEKINKLPIKKLEKLIYSSGYYKNKAKTINHVHVISNRLGWVKEKTPEKTELALMKVVPKKYWHLINTLFVLHGQKICFTRNPKCNICPIEKDCPKIGL